jgi:HEAT repeat protein
METDTAAELVARAAAAAQVAEETDDWDEYRALLWRAAADGPAAQAIGLELIAAGDADTRAMGCDLLGNAGDQNEAVRTTTATALIALAEREGEGPVLWSLARAIERTYDERAVPVLVRLAGHADAEVRQVVASSFAGLLTGRPDGADVRTLIALTRDEDPEVRNWATFTLGFQSEADSPAIRAALWERTSDSHADAREEGIHGLARRHDPRAVPLLVELLESPEGAHVLTFSAAEVMGAPELLPSLREYDLDDPGVRDAVNACDPGWRGRMDASAWQLVTELHRLRPDLDAAVHMERFDSGLTLGLGVAGGEAAYDVEGLLARAADDLSVAVGMVTADHPPSAPQ